MYLLKLYCVSHINFIFNHLMPNYDYMVQVKFVMMLYYFESYCKHGAI